MREQFIKKILCIIFSVSNFAQFCSILSILSHFVYSDNFVYGVNFESLSISINFVLFCLCCSILSNFVQLCPFDPFRPILSILSILSDFVQFFPFHPMRPYFSYFPFCPNQINHALIYQNFPSCFSDSFDMGFDIQNYYTLQQSLTLEDLAKAGSKHTLKGLVKVINKVIFQHN